MPNDIDMRDGGLRIAEARRTFIALWAAVAVLKLVVASQLPLFVDEAFYWQEGQHLSWAYSDLPGLTAWLIRLGVEVAGNNHLGARLPFLLMGAALPWMMVHIVRREFGEGRAPWLAGSATVLLPLAGTLGIMALPDVPMALATMLCIDAGTRLLRRVDHGAAVVLALGLAIGALSHYRFIAVIGVGVIALAMLPAGRQALRDPRVWIAIAFGAAAWVPLLAWNLENAEAGLRFQLVERHPWALHASGLRFIPLQAVFVTPLLLAALLLGGWRAARPGNPEAVRLLGLLGGLVVLGFFGLGFFADTERVSFHWPLPGYLALIALVPAVLAGWPRWLRRATWALAGIGLAAVFAYYIAVSIPSLRAHSAAWKWYPSNFAGWNVLADAVEDELAGMPGGTRLVAGNFKIGAELTKRGFAIVSGGTDNHSMLVDLRTKYPELTGKVAENALVAADITINKNMVPFDTRSAFQTSGFRLGTPAITTRGAKEDLMVQVAAWIEEVLHDPENEAVIAKVRGEVNETRKNYPLFAW